MVMAIMTGMTVIGKVMTMMTGVEADMTLMVMTMQW